MATTDFYILERPLQADQEGNQVAREESSFTRPKAEAEPEARLWKVCAEASSPRLGAIEWIVFLLIGALSLGTLAYCFSELFQLISNGALVQTVCALLSR